jgi:hypothetical protein
MAIRIEIAKLYSGKLEVRIGDLSGSTTLSNVLKEDVLAEISDKIEELLKDEQIKEKT